ncbi:NAD(P)/FAD-dependent oxidoreductase [Caballeronia sp. LZ035]|uniref:flavin-containing monooxygenase n=1 Tax=Caballeronia sp. LZ035 TaxID=3038568 RepID=UPI00285BF6A6|nr:NAD(P)/FAD-dependent oxidoreductase [Caballeronia sp. LZ035]MDR5761326.1 NAD(P)/FAD-dependent oxidoreductase [Caballeronia sp. LZ035]
MNSTRVVNGERGHRYDAIIIGAGFSGLYQLHMLRDRLGLDVRLLEAGDGVGGTWHWNRYPGARCDSESYYYCYTFSDELQDEWEWSERYPDHNEIRRYLNHVADRLALRPDIQLDTRVTQASYEETQNLWRVSTENGEQFEARYLVTAVGCLSTANVPSLPGLATFAGERYHTGRWPAQGVAFEGKRVGLIGTGSTGIQAAPVIAQQAERLTVLQRTANYSVPARNGPVDQRFRDWAATHRKEIRAKSRGSINGHPFDVSTRSALEVSADEREQAYHAAWERGGLRFRATFKDLLTDREANETASQFIRERIADIVKDPAIAEKLTPRDHLYATKRPPIDTHYFETFNRDNVELVDLKATPIVEVVPEGIRTSDALIPLDVIVFATGFDALTGPLMALNIEGRGGLKLKDAWAHGPRTYLGLQSPGFPNLFTITGPGSPSVLTNMPIAIEQHVEWITACIGRMRDQGATRIEPADTAAENWARHVNEVADATLMPMASSSWYLGANIPGKPRVFMPYAGGMARYAEICGEVASKGYEGFLIS